MKNIYTSNIYAGGAHPINEDDIEEAVATKQDIITGAATSITDNNLTENRALTSNVEGKVDVAITTTTELEFVHGVTSAIQTQLNNKASISLDNLSTDGQMIIDSQNGTISNCILEIPQNLKLEFNNGTVTLKAGSIITRTGSTYSTITTTEDKTWSSATQANAKLYLFATNGGNTTGLYRAYRIENVGSGSSLPADDSTYSTFFNTTDKLIYGWDGNAWVASNTAYPLAIVETDENAAIKGFAKDSNGRDMIFNGAGFIGHHAFVYPNPNAGLAGNGFNADGSLASRKLTQTSLLIANMTASRTNFVMPYGLTDSPGSRVGYIEVEEKTPQAWALQYVKSENKSYVYNGSTYGQEYETPLVIWSTDANNVVTDFTIRQPVRTATVEMVEKKQNDITTITGYDATKTQTLKNVNGTLTWVDN